MDGRKNNRMLYKAAFSKLHAFTAAYGEDNMNDDKNLDKYKNITKMVTEPAVLKKLRLRRSVIVCAAIAALICAMSVGTFAATGGETANPIRAVKVMINGQTLSADAVRSDGSIEATVKSGDELSCEDPDTGTSAYLNIMSDGGKVRIDKDMNIKYTQDGSDNDSENSESAESEDKPSFEIDVSDDADEDANEDDGDPEK